MQCRFCAGDKPDYTKKIPSLRKALKGIRAEFLMFDYPECFEQVAGPCITGLDSEGNVTGFTATQCVRYTHIKNGWGVIVHPCFEKGTTAFLAKGDVTKPTDVETFTDFFRKVMTDGEKRGRKGALTFGQIVSCLRELGDGADDADIERLAEKLQRTVNRIRQVLRAEGKTLDDAKRLAREQPGPRTMKVPVEGVNVRPDADYYVRTDEGELLLIKAPEGEPEK